jgi:hypothetical protein
MGTTPLRYQWSRNGAEIAGSTNRVFTIASVQATYIGDYFLVANNSFGSATSQVAHLTYTGFTAPRFTGVPGVSNGVFRALLTGATGAVIRVESSTDLLNWVSLQTFTNASGAWTVTYTNQPAKARNFYRAVVP